MKNTLPDILEHCLKALEDGASLAEVLAAYPQQAEELQHLLLIAQAARRYGETSVPPEILVRNKNWIIAKAAKSLPSRPNGWFRPILKASLTVFIVILFLVGGAGSVLSASLSSLPGDLLYGIKRGMEDIQLLGASDPDKRAGLEETLNLRRVDEVNSLLQNMREELVRFQGKVTDGSGNTWLVASIPVAITDETLIEGDLIPGLLIEVSGWTRAESVVADRIIILQLMDPAEEREMIGPPGGVENEFGDGLDMPDEKSIDDEKEDDDSRKEEGSTGTEEAIETDPDDESEDSSEHDSDNDYEDDAEDDD